MVTFSNYGQFSEKIHGYVKRKDNSGMKSARNKILCQKLHIGV